MCRRQQSRKARKDIAHQLVDVRNSFKNISKIFFDFWNFREKKIRFLFLFHDDLLRSDGKTALGHCGSACSSFYWLRFCRSGFWDNFLFFTRQHFLRQLFETIQICRARGDISLAVRCGCATSLASASLGLLVEIFSLFLYFWKNEKWLIFEISKISRMFQKGEYGRLQRRKRFWSEHSWFRSCWTRRMTQCKRKSFLSWNADLVSEIWFFKIWSGFWDNKSGSWDNIFQSVSSLGESSLGLSSLRLEVRRGSGSSGLRDCLDEFARFFEFSKIQSRAQNAF